MAALESLLSHTKSAQKLARMSAARPESPLWTTSLDGRLCCRKPWEGSHAALPCLSHDLWLGPIKGVTASGNRYLQVEFFLSPLVDQHSLDPQRTNDSAALLAELKELASDYLKGQPLPSSWSSWLPPPVDWLHQCLTRLGYEVTADDLGGLRTSLPRRGCDLQAQATVGPGQLRFRMPLGSWKHISPAARIAMAALIQEANDRTHLARLAWLSRNGEIRIEAQVDLTALPADVDRPACAALWEHTLTVTMASLELLMRRLGLELQILADPAQRSLAEYCAQQLGLAPLPAIEHSLAVAPSTADAAASLEIVPSAYVAEPDAR